MRRHHACMVVAVLAVACGMHPSAGAPFSLSSDEFPIVMTGMGARTLGYIDEVADLDCDYIHIYVMSTSTNRSDLDRDLTFFDNAYSNGVKVMANLRARDWILEPNGLDQMLTCVREFKDHPALGFWCMFVEPDNEGVSPSVVQQYYDALKLESPGVPIANAHAWSTNWGGYENGQDILMNDNYPVSDEVFPNAPIDQMTTFTRQAVDQGEPVIPILQACEATWRGSGMRYPNRDELRYWVYACTILGARGLAWHTYSAAREDPTWVDGTFGPMLLNLRAFVDTVEPAHGVDKVHGGGSDTYFLGVWDRGSAGTWVALVNDQDSSRTQTFSMEGRITDADLWPLDGTRAGEEQIRGGTLQSLTLGPWEACVWQSYPEGLNVPDNMDATPRSADRIDVEWNDTATTETGFKIDRHSAINGNWIRVGEVPVDTTRYRDVTVLPDRTYTYRVKAYNGDGNGRHSSEVSARTLPGMAFRPGAGDDDAEEDVLGGAVHLPSGDLELVENGATEQVVGIRFPGISIPRGATIHGATIEFTVDETSSGSTILTLRGQATDDAAAFATNDYNISARATTGESVAWDVPAWNNVGAAGPDRRTPDLARIIQAIVDRPGWVKGNALALIVTGTGVRVAVSYDQDPTAAPFLQIHCTPGLIDDDLVPATDHDDAEEDVLTGEMHLESGDLELVDNGATEQVVGIRFPGVPLPQGALIHAADVQFTVDEPTSNATSLTLRGQAIDDAPTFTLSPSNIGARATTAQSVTWDVPAWNGIGQCGADQRTPDLASIIQAIVDRQGWAGGNALALIVSGDGTRVAVSHDGDADAAPLLRVQYQSPRPRSFVAYNDLAWFSGQLSTRITTFTTTSNYPEGDPEGRLLDYATGEPLPIRVTVQGGGSPKEDQGLDPNPSTDAYYMFNGKLDASGAIGYSAEDLVLTLTGLCPDLQYEFVLYGDRNGPSYTSTASRYQHATLSGADSFANTSTPGTTILTDSVPNDTTLYNAGYNNTNGFVTRFSQVDPGADGKIVVTLSRDTDLDYYSYANAFMLAGHDVVKVAKGATWAYRKGTAEASYPPVDWRKRTFNDTAWSSGAAPFGYGDGPYRTTLDDMYSNYTCVFLRKAFWIDQPTRVSRVELRALVDDGFIAWLNGVEVGRTNMTSGPGTFIPYDGHAVNSIEPAFEWAVTLEGRTIPPLVAGTNILTVQAFNKGLLGSDVTLDFQMTIAEGARVVLDADGDGMPDPWETDNFGNTNVANAGTEQDFDEDGLLNVQEYIAGTHPNDPDTLFQVNVGSSDGKVVVSVDGVEATEPDYTDMTRYYAIEQRSVLDASLDGWAPATGYEAVPAITGTIVYTNATDDGLTFYRGRVWLEAE